MSAFLDALRAEPLLLLDGAMGTMLQRAGLAAGESAELWNISQPEVVASVHRAYRLAGARCLTTNTFQSNPMALGRKGRDRDLERINQTALELAHASGSGAFVIASVGPASGLLGAADWKRVARSLAGADALFLETFHELSEIRQALEGCMSANTACPVLLSIAYVGGSPECAQTPEGLQPAELARAMREFDLAALGVNCGRNMGLSEVASVLRQYRVEVCLPLLARPNTGSPAAPLSATGYSVAPAEMAAGLQMLVAAGARVVGGCCGTTPEHIGALAAEAARLGLDGRKNSKAPAGAQQKGPGLPGP